ncbi:MAG: DHHA1 domain-containing protein, partial [Oscillospiraceae bacterium]
IDYAKINRAMFDVKSIGRILVEQAATKSMEFFFDNRCSMIIVTTNLIALSGIDPADFDGLTSITLQVEGVQIGLLVKQREDELFKVSVRTTDEIDASAICAEFGGGGHVRAAGCELKGTLAETKSQLLTACRKYLGRPE